MATNGDVIRPISDEQLVKPFSKKQDRIAKHVYIPVSFDAEGEIYYALGIVPIKPDVQDGMESGYYWEDVNEKVAHWMPYSEPADE